VRQLRFPEQKREVLIQRIERSQERPAQGLQKPLQFHPLHPGQEVNLADAAAEDRRSERIVLAASRHRLAMDPHAVFQKREPDRGTVRQEPLEGGVEAGDGLRTRASFPGIELAGAKCGPQSVEQPGSIHGPTLHPGYRSGAACH